MSRSRFTPITSDLLVRKGEARPLDNFGTRSFEFTRSTEAQGEPSRTALEREDEEHIQVEYEKWMREQEMKPAHTSTHGHTHHAHTDEATRRCTIRLSHVEYERLGIVAVKREITRQQALRQAVERYLTAAKRQYKAHCNCLGGACNGSC
jgi:hypothetical protein